MHKFSYLFFFAIVLSCSIFAQNTLPMISVKNSNGKTVISWRNNYSTVIKTINIQRSNDSVKNFSTITSILNPQKKGNEYVDIKPSNNNMYYRVFVAFDGGNYFFSKAARPEGTVISAVSIIPDKKNIPVVEEKKIKNLPQVKTDKSEKSDNPAVEKILMEKVYSVPHQFIFNPINHVFVNPVLHPFMYPSSYLFTGKENNIIVILPNAETKKYVIKFFNDKNMQLFELNKLHESRLLIEKGNFLHTGWFFFEIYENGKLIEKNKLNIAVENKSVDSQNK